MANNIAVFRLLFICLAALFLFKSGYCGQTNYSHIPDDPKYFNPPGLIQPEYPAAKAASYNSYNYKYSSYSPQEEFSTQTKEPIFSPLPEADKVLAKDSPPADYSQDAYFAPIEGFSQPYSGAASNPGAIDYQPEPKTITGVNANLAKPQFNPEYHFEEKEENEENNEGTLLEKRPLSKASPD